MTTIKMSKLAEALINRDIPADFEMSGGNCGTIYFGPILANGEREFAFGPGNFSMDTIEFEDHCWGVNHDGDEYNRFEGDEDDFSVTNVANQIHSWYQNKVKEDNGILTIDKLIEMTKHLPRNTQIVLLHAGDFSNVGCVAFPDGYGTMAITLESKDDFDARQF